MSTDLSPCFWNINEEHVYQRVTTKQWREMLLDDKDKPIIRGRVRRVYARRLGAGVLELRLAPLEEVHP